MQNSREWYEAKALECMNMAADMTLQPGGYNVPLLNRLVASAQVWATLANAADRRSHGSITDEPSKRITP